MRGRLHRIAFAVDAPDNADMEDLAKFLGCTRRIDGKDATPVVHSLWLGG